MNKKTKYFFLIKSMIITIFLIILMSTIIKIFNIYRYILPVLFDTLIVISKVVNTLSIISLILVIVYLIYLITLYLKSKFYQYTRINVFEAIYYGIIDIHVVYDQLIKLNDIKELNVDMRQSMLTFNKNKKQYCIKFLEIFGKINNKIENEMWVALSKPKKEFGRTYYQKKIKFPNPIREINEYIEYHKKENGKNIIGYVVLNGFFKSSETSEQILAPYEILSVIS